MCYISLFLRLTVDKTGAVEVASVSFDSNQVSLISAFPSLSPLGITQELIKIMFHAFLDGLCSKSVPVGHKMAVYEFFSIELLRSHD